ncbi:hypothetical protein IMY05_005G0205200 [Salix suchowensis]|nr:hypothetical protein IMY05_005G0205200 [Salix suchowensis]
MDVEEKNAPFRGLVNPPYAAHGIAKGLPPYTSNKLGDSFVHFSQLESLLRGTRGQQAVHKFSLLKRVFVVIKGTQCILNEKRGPGKVRYLSVMDKYFENWHCFF